MIKKFAVATLVMLLAGFTLTASAQEDTPVDGVYVVQAPGGAMVDNGDGTFQLIVGGITPQLAWVVSTPGVNTGLLDAQVLATEWSANPDGLSTLAVLSTADTTVLVDLTAPVYDDLLGEMLFTATVLDVVLAEEGDSKDEPAPPAAFEAAVLAIEFDDAFIEGLIAGAAVLEEEGRVSRTGTTRRPGPPRHDRPERPDDSSGG